MRSRIDGFKRLARECQLGVGVNKVIVGNSWGFGYKWPMSFVKITFRFTISLRKNQQKNKIKK